MTELTQKELMELAIIGASQQANDFFHMYQESNNKLDFELYCKYRDISNELLEKIRYI